MSKNRQAAADLTVGRPLTQILFFSLPLVFGTLFQQLYSFADTVIVGRFLGVDALGAVGTTYSLHFLTLGFVQGACIGFGIPIAQSAVSYTHLDYRYVVIHVNCVKLALLGTKGTADTAVVAFCLHILALIVGITLYQMFCIIWN